VNHFMTGTMNMYKAISESAFKWKNTGNHTMKVTRI
jgi:hypothetical protein